MPVRSVRMFLAGLAVTFTVGCSVATNELSSVPTSDPPTVTRATLQTTTSTAPSFESLWVSVRYRSDPVDLAVPGRFELLIPDSTLVDAVAYDPTNGYLLIALDGVWYHYCRVPDGVWDRLSTAASAGSFYNAELRGSFDCRAGGIPSY